MNTTVCPTFRNLFFFFNPLFLSLLLLMLIYFFAFIFDDDCAFLDGCRGGGCYFWTSPCFRNYIYIVCKWWSFVSLFGFNASLSQYQNSPNSVISNNREIRKQERSSSSVSVKCNLNTTDLSSRWTLDMTDGLTIDPP